MLTKYFVALLLLTAQTVYGQTNIIRPDVIETIYSTKNYVKNPTALKNTTGTGTSSAAIARDTATASKLDGIASYTCDTSATNGYCRFDTTTIREGDKTGTCEARVTFKGNATLYSLRITDTSSTLVDLALTNESDWKEVFIPYACGSTRDVRLVQTTAGTSPAINIGRIYYGKVVNSVAQSLATAKGDILVATGPNTFVKKSVGANGEVLISDSTQTDGTRWSASGGTPFNQSVRIDGFATYASTNTKVIRWNSQVTTGTDLTFSDTAGGGGIVTVNTAGVYEGYVIFAGDTGYGAGVVKNGTQGALPIFSTTLSTHLCRLTSTGGDSAPCPFVDYFSPGDYVWAQTDGVGISLSPTRLMFVMRRVD